MADPGFIKRGGARFFFRRILGMGLARQKTLTPLCHLPCGARKKSPLRGVFIIRGYVMSPEIVLPWQIHMVIAIKLP